MDELKQAKEGEYGVCMMFDPLIGQFRKVDYQPDGVHILPTAEDLDAVEEEKRIAELTNHDPKS